MKIDLIVTGIVALISAAIGALLAPWAKWKLEQKKLERDDQIKLMTELRLFLEKNEPKNEDFLSSVNYIRIRPYLTDSLIKDLEDFKTQVIVSTFRSTYKARLLQEIDLIENQWKIGLSRNSRKKNSYEVKSDFTITVSEGTDFNRKTKDDDL